MASPATLISVGEYLKTSCYEPDAEYVDGHIERRPMGEFDHGDLQSQFSALFRSNRCKPYFRCISELRVQVASTRFRIPDICLVRSSTPRQPILKVPPLLCIEILSPEDTIPRTMVRVRDFLAMGIPEVWIVDPETRTIHVCAGTTTTTRADGALPVPETPITLSLAELFSTLDDQP